MNGDLLYNIFLFVVMIACVIYLIFALCYILTFIERRRYMKATLCSLQNIMDMYNDESDYEICIEQINIMFDDIISKNSYTKRKFASVVALFDFFISAINCENGDLKDIEDMADLKRKALEVKGLYERKNPLDQIKGANSALLNQVIQYSKDNDREKFDVAINRLAVEMKSLQDALFEKEKNSKKQDAMTKCGIILSVVFGIMTFIQFFI